MSQDAHAASGGRQHVPHVLPLRIYIGVWAALIVFTVITVAVSYFDFGQGNLVVAMVVATAKASLVCAFFMHLKYDDRFNTMVVVAAFGFLSLLFMFSLVDLPMRGEIEPVEYGTIQVLPRSSIPGLGEGGPGHGTEASGTAAPGEAAAPHGDSTAADSAGAAGGH